MCVWWGGHNRRGDQSWQEGQNGLWWSRPQKVFFFFALQHSTTKHSPLRLINYLSFYSRFPICFSFNPLFSPGDLLPLMLLLFVAREVITPAAVPLTPPTEEKSGSGEGGKERADWEGNGWWRLPWKLGVCCQSTSLVVERCRAGTWIFELHGHRWTGPGPESYLETQAKARLFF